MEAVEMEDWDELRRLIVRGCMTINPPTVGQNKEWGIRKKNEEKYK